MDREALEDLFDCVGPVHFRRMFGGMGIFRDGVMFAMDINDDLYIKAGPGNQSQLEAAGSRPFLYDSKNKDGTIRQVSIGYWTLPDIAYDDPDERVLWLRPAIAVAQARSAEAAKKPRAASKRQVVKKPAKKPAE